MCRQAEMRRHDGLRAEGRSPYVGLRDSLRTAEKKLWGCNFFGGLNKIFGGRKYIWPPNTIITRRRRKKKKKKPRFFRLGAEKYDFRAPKEQRPTGRLRSKGLLVCVLIGAR